MRNDYGLIIRYMRYVFWRVYVWQLRLWGEKRQPEVSAMIAVVILIGLHLIALDLTLTIFMGWSLDSFRESSQIMTIVALLPLMIFANFYYLTSGRYKKLVKEYSSFKESRKQAFWRGTGIVLHIFACFAYMALLTTL